jgi:monoamine oxidase
MAEPTVTPTFTLASDTLVKGEYDVIVIGSGMGGLVASTELAVRGARVLLLEKYIIPGGSSAFFCRHGYTFDVGSSVMFGCGDKVRLICSLPMSINTRKQDCTLCMGQNAHNVSGIDYIWNTFIWN